MNMLRTLLHWTVAMMALAFMITLTAGDGADAQDDDDLEGIVESLCATPSPDGGSARLDAQCAAAVRDATREAAGWPDHDPTAIGERGYQVELARIEAGGWPNFDPSSLADQVARMEEARVDAAEEAARWPNFDSTAIDTSSSGEVVGEPIRVSEMLRGDLSPIWFDD